MSDQPEQTVALALGANLGDRMESLRMAVKSLAPYVTITAMSPVYETAAAYVTDQPAFLNAVLVGKTKLEPLPLLWMVKDIESEMGRVPTFRYGPRAIDIDILFYGAIVLASPELMIPHPRMAERDFVLYPLNDVAPGWQHPHNGRTVAAMLAALPGNKVTPFGTL